MKNRFSHFPLVASHRADTFGFMCQGVEFLPLTLKGTLSSVESSSKEKALREICGFSCITGTLFMERHVTAVSTKTKFPTPQLYQGGGRYL